MVCLKASLGQLKLTQKALKYNFSYFPLVRWWPPLLHYGKKENFSDLPTGIWYLFKATYDRFHTGNGRCSTVVVCLVKILSHSPRRALKRVTGDSGLAVAKRACCVICSCIFPSKMHYAKRSASQGEASLLGFILDLLYPLDLLLYGLVAADLYCSFDGVFGSDQSR